jgi:hypothetical protein
MNGYIDLLEGNELELNNNQLHQAVHDIMGSTWQERFKTQNLEVANFTLPTLMSWFKKQEEVAQANIKRRNESMSRSKRHHVCPSLVTPFPHFQFDSLSFQNAGTYRNNHSRLKQKSPAGDLAMPACFI